MTTARTAAKAPPFPSPLSGGFRLPDPPPREPDEMTSYDYVHQPGNSHHLAQHFGNPDTTLVVAERWVVPYPNYGVARRRRPDLMIAFNVNPAAYESSNGYIISEQGKPPDFVLEVASASTAKIDLGAKRDDYEALGVGEYWRFDATGEYYGARLAGERLVDGKYEEIEIRELADGSLEGYSAALHLNLRWERNRLGWHVPETGEHITTFDALRADLAAERAARRRERAARRREQAARRQAEARADSAEAQSAAEREARRQAEAQFAAEREARRQAEARLRELEAELRRRRNQ